MISERWQASGSRSTQSSAARPSAGKIADELPEIDPVEDLQLVPHAVFGRKLHAGALPDALSRVLLVLHVPQVGGRCELLVVSVLDPGFRERGLEPC